MSARCLVLPTPGGPRWASDAQGRNHIRWLFFVVFYAIVANVPFWIASRWFGLLPLGWFCLEYAGIGLLALCIPRMLAAGLLLLAIAADLLSAVSKTYYLAPTECLDNLGALQELSGARLAALGGLIAILLLSSGIAMTLRAGKIRGMSRCYAVLGLVSFIALGVSADCGTVVRETGHMPGLFHSMRPSDTARYNDYGNLWVSRYPLLRLVRNEWLFGGYRGKVSASLGDSARMASASAQAFRASGLVPGRRSQELPNVVLVLVESWGLNWDSVVRDGLVRPYLRPELAARYQVSQGTVPFFGSTVGGEARELCGSGIGFEIENVPEQGLEPCLPSQLASRGYHTIALHGMSGHMFRREVWYRSIGFQEQWFRDRFRQRGLPDCVGAFVGTCDAAVAGVIGQRLQTREATPDFAYWVTLNSHLPLPAPSGVRGAVSCADSPLLSGQPTLCSWYQLIYNVHDSVARLAVGPLGRPTVFVIVGDHSPPFANPTLRDKFSSKEVPYILLVPRQADAGPRQGDRAANGR